jgi:hypothetical protein
MKPTYIQTFFECYYYYDNTPWSSTNTYKHTFPKNILKTGQDSTSGLRAVARRFKQGWV